MIRDGGGLVETGIRSETSLCEVESIKCRYIWNGLVAPCVVAYYLWGGFGGGVGWTEAPVTPAGLFFDRWGDLLVQLEQPTSSSRSSAGPRRLRRFSIFRFSSEPPHTCLVPSALGRGLFRLVSLARATRGTRQTRPVGHGEIGCHGSPRDGACQPAGPQVLTGIALRQTLTVTDQSACNQPYLSPAPRLQLDVTSSRQSTSSPVIWHTSRLCQSKEYAWNLPLQLCPCPCLALVLHHPSPKRRRPDCLTARLP